MNPQIGSRRAPRAGALVALFVTLLLPQIPGPALLSAQEPDADRPRAERITVSFRDAPLREVLRVFAEVSGRSIVLGAGLGDARVTAEIQDQPWDAALQAILEAQGLSARETETGIIQVMPVGMAAGPR